MSGPKKFWKENKWTIIVLIAIIGGLAGGSYYFFVLSPQADDTPTPTVKTASTFTTISSLSGEDVSNFVEWDIWVPKSGATFDDGMEDITALTTNFEREITGKDADDISIDLRDHPYAWAEITGNTVFNNTFYLIYGGSNYDYIFHGHQESSDVNFNILNSTGGAITIPGWASGDGVAVADNFTAVADAPHYTLTDNQYGDVGWELSATEFTDLSAREKEAIWDEAKYRDQYPTYNPTVDTVNELDRDFEKITNAFALKYTFNETINVTDGATLEVNCTIDRGYPIDVLVSGANLYMVFYEGIDFYTEPYTFGYEMSYGADISITTVISCRVDVPGSLSTATLAKTYSTIGT